MGSKHSKGTVRQESFQLPFAALQEATNNFDDKFFIGEGGFGKVYRGVLRDGTKVALKRRNRLSRRGIEEFRTEIEILSQFRHPNLVSLIGYCNDNNEMILIFEYLENGNLWSHLDGSDLRLHKLSWEQRLEICIGAARGLHYLHTSRIIHGDVKSANILLDENFVPKIADFGISRKWTDLDQTHLTTRIIGTLGYIAPEYAMRGQLTEKSDVYSFGVVLVQVLCARSDIGQSFRTDMVITEWAPRDMVRLTEWAVESQKKGKLEQIVDPNLLVKIRPESLRKFGETAVKCLASSGVDRPSMSDVQWNLEYALHLQEPVIPDDPEEDSSFPIRELSPVLNDFTHVDASSNVSQVGTSNLDDISSDELIRPR